MQAMQWNSLGPLGVQALKDMDRSRQARGQMLERAGHGPQETPSTILLARPGFQLRSYGQHDGGNGGQPVLLVPAPIKRAYIWDMAPAISVVQRWRERGYRVYLAEWLPMVDADTDADAPAATDTGLADYGSRFLAACQQAIAADSGNARITVVGHSLGGILAAIYSCMHPQHVAATVLLESPLHFEPASCCFNPLVRATPDARQIAETFRHVPGAFLNMISAMAEPQAFGWERIADRWQSMFDPVAWRTHMQVERWTHDEFALPGRLFTDIVEALYRRDDFMQGRLEIEGRRIGPGDIASPLVAVADMRSKVIPPQAVLPFVEASASSRKQVFAYEGDVGVNLQHVGVLVGRNAHATVWPAIFDWLGAPPARPAG